MHNVQRAIIVAAGTGTRMRPLTLETPKPLVRVGGTRLIDTAIRGLLENGITEIHVVVGYQKEQFRVLEEEYPGLTLIENPYYDTCNNISSLYVAKEYLRDVIILDGDQQIKKPQVLSPAFARSGYNAVWTDADTKEWLLTVQNDIVTSCSRTGGSGGWQLYSISRWSEEDGRRLRRHLEIEFEEKKHRDIYWDDVALFCYPDEYQLSIFPMEAGDVTEVDSLEELAALDARYQSYLKKAQSTGIASCPANANHKEEIQP